MGPRTAPLLPRRATPASSRARRTAVCVRPVNSASSRSDLPCWYAAATNSISWRRCAEVWRTDAVSRTCSSTLSTGLDGYDNDPHSPGGRLRALTHLRDAGVWARGGRSGLLEGSLRRLRAKLRGPRPVLAAAVPPMRWPLSIRVGTVRGGVRLSARLADHPPGSTGMSRLCQGRSHPPRHLPGSVTRTTTRGASCCTAQPTGPRELPAVKVNPA
jgi:hypothetical protein